MKQEIEDIRRKYLNFQRKFETLAIFGSVICVLVNATAVWDFYIGKWVLGVVCLICGYVDFFCVLFSAHKRRDLTAALERLRFLESQVNDNER